MLTIIATIQSQETSTKVVNLQAALAIILPAIGFRDFKISSAELAAKKALDGTTEAIKILQDKFLDKYTMIRALKTNS